VLSTKLSELSTKPVELSIKPRVLPTKLSELSIKAHVLSIKPHVLFTRCEYVDWNQQFYKSIGLSFSSNQLSLCQYSAKCLAFWHFSEYPVFA